MNLFLALLLASFGSNVLTEKEDEDNKIAEAIERIQRFSHYLVESITRVLCRRKQGKKNNSIETNNNENEIKNQVANLDLVDTVPLPKFYNLEEFTASVLTNNDVSPINEDIEMQPMNTESTKSRPEWQILHLPPDCFPAKITKLFNCCGKCFSKSFKERWIYLRTVAHYLVEHRYFEWLIIASILASSATLVSE